MKHFIVSLVLLSLLTINSAWPKSSNLTTSTGIEYPPRFTTLVNDIEHGRIEVVCHEIKNESSRIACSFDQVVVQHINTSTLKDKISKIKDTPNTEIKNDWQKFCRFLDEDHKLNERISNNYAKSKSDDERKNILAFKEMCTHPSVDNYLALMRSELEKDMATCQIINKSYKQEFKYNFSIKKWVCQEDPASSDWGNDCGIINIAYLEKDSRDGFSDWAWIYTSRGIVTNKSGTVLASSCSELTNGKNSIENEVAYYTAHSNRAEPTNCKYIDFS